MRLPYRIVRPLARIALKIYFKKIYLTGLANLPKNKPLILAANHPTAFLEPCLLACLLPVPLHFMVRGDFFQKPLFRKMLESLQMIPMYRKKDIGMKGVRNNFSSLEVVYDLLKDHKTVLILAEGNTIHEKRLRPIKKGTARMAIGAIEKHPNLDVQIIPIGVNYTNVLQFRSTVMLDIGPPIAASSYLHTPDWHKAKVINKITKDLEEQLLKQVVHLASSEEEQLTDVALEIYRNENQHATFPIQEADSTPLHNEIGLANYLNSLEGPSKNELYQDLKNYKDQLQANELEDIAVKYQRPNSWVATLLLLIGYPLYLWGYVFNFLPLYFGKWWSEHKVREVVFIAPIKASFSLGAYLVYFGLLTLVGLLLQEKWFWLLWLTIPIVGCYALYFYDFKTSYQLRQQWARLSASQQASLLSLRNSLLARLSTVF